jgi:hypothetical protein
MPGSAWPSAACCGASPAIEPCSTIGPGVPAGNAWDWNGDHFVALVMRVNLNMRNCDGHVMVEALTVMAL